MDFKGITSTFRQLNVPTDSAVPVIIGQLSYDHTWIIYDLQKEAIVINDAEYQKVTDVWKSMELPMPVYVNSENTRELLVETEDSVSMRWQMALQMWLFMGVVPMLPFVLIFWYLGRRSKRLPATP